MIHKKTLILAILIAFSGVGIVQGKVKKGTINKVKKNDTATFNEIVHSEGIVVVDFFATWCGPCKRLHPILKKLAKKNTNITFVQVDVDQNKNLMQQHKVRGMPTIVIYKNGVEVFNRAGFMTEKELQKIISRYL